MAVSNTSPSTALSEHWVCPKCTMKNSINCVTCTACLSHKPGHSQWESVSQVGAVKRSLSFRLRSLIKPPEWKCPTCTVVNEGHFKQCKCCGSVRFTKKPPRSNSSKVEGRAGRKNESVPEETSGKVSAMGTMLGSLELSNSGEKGKEKGAQEGKSAGEQWTCHFCTLLNSFALEKCAACEACRPSGLLTTPHPLSTAPHPHGESGAGVPVKPLIPSHSEEYVPGHKENSTLLPTANTLPPTQVKGRSLTWQCDICEAYNMVKNQRQCGMCGFGTIPKSYTSSMATSGPSDGSVEVPINNWTKCLDETRSEDVLEANTVYHRIQRYCIEHGEPFTDPDFPPTDKSLYIDPKKPVSRWKLYKWGRPPHVKGDFESGNMEWTVVREPRPEDIGQGELGNCCLLSALAVVAEQPQLIKDIIITKKFSPEVRAYQIRLCKDGHWQVVVVDDYLPCFRDGKLAFSRAHKKQLWVPLIEKALAKLYGSYEALESGKLLLGLSVLTGLSCEIIDLKNEDHDLTWARLLSFRENSFPMNTLCIQEDEKDHAEKGLVVKHAYSILDVRQLGRERLVRLRNPWGKYSWRGSWSDQDPCWHSQPWLRDELQAVGNEAGMFWMGAQDFFKYFSGVNVCKYRPNWHSVRSEGKLHPFAASRIKTLAFEVHSTTEVDISIYQPTSRCDDSGQVNMAVLVLRYPSTHQLGHDSHTTLPIACTLESTFHFRPIVTTSGLLAPGSYVILPLAFNHYHHLVGTDKGREKEREKTSVQMEREDGAVSYVVAVFSAQALAYNSILTGPGFLSESLFLLAEKTGRVSKPHPNMVTYEMTQGDLCRIIVAVNYDYRHHFTVSITVLESVNIVSSRGALCTKDCIPPRHRQVLTVLTPEHLPLQSYQSQMKSSCTELNSQGQWGAEHTPELTSTNSELHSPRFINFINA